MTFYYTDGKHLNSTLSHQIAFKKYSTLGILYESYIAQFYVLCDNKVRLHLCVIKLYNVEFIIKDSVLLSVVGLPSLRWTAWRSSAERAPRLNWVSERIELFKLGIRYVIYI